MAASEEVLTRQSVMPCGIVLVTACILATPEHFIPRCRHRRLLCLLFRRSYSPEEDRVKSGFEGEHAESNHRLMYT